MKRHRSPYRDLDFFKGWAEDDLRRLERLAEVVEYEPGEIVVVEGRTAREFLVVVCGSLKVETRRGSWFVGAGETLGEHALLTGAPHPAAVIAETYVKALLLGQREFHGLLSEAPSMGRRLAISLAGQLRTA